MPTRITPGSPVRNGGIHVFQRVPTVDQRCKRPILRLTEEVDGGVQILGRVVMHSSNGETVSDHLFHEQGNGWRGRWPPPALARRRAAIVASPLRTRRVNLTVRVPRPHRDHLLVLRPTAQPRPGRRCNLRRIVSPNSIVACPGRRRLLGWRCVRPPSHTP